jgi:glycosyltransferase involved in cell wall biosynthesis
MVQFFVNNNEVFKDYQYHLVGAVSNLPADVEYLNEIKKLAATVDNVFIHENCKYEELMDLYSRAKIFWHGTGYGVDENKEPEKMEHFGITTVEAMSYGAVPVVINKGGQKETVENGVNGFRWDSEEECVKNSKKLIDDDNLRMKMAKISAERSKDYSIEEFYNRHREVFHELQI